MSFPDHGASVDSDLVFHLRSEVVAVSPSNLSESSLYATGGAESDSNNSSNATDSGGESPGANLNGNNGAGTIGVGSDSCLNWAPQPALMMQQHPPPESKSKSEPDPHPHTQAEDPPMLHKACQVFPNNSIVIESALLLDPKAVTRSASIPARSCTAKRISLPSTFDTAGWFGKFRDPSKKKMIRKDYQYPINIALHNGADAPIIRMLASFAPEVLLFKDGSQGYSSIFIALLHSKKDQLESIVDILLDSNSSVASALDRHKNAPIHFACQRSKVSLKVVVALAKKNSKTLKHKNLRGQTPLMIAQRNNLCDDKVVNFLLRRGTT